MADFEKQFHALAQFVQESNEMEPQAQQKKSVI
jgi:hypothetical protein